MSEKYHGKCLCESVEFEIEGKFNHFFLCHCSRCRMTSGSAHGANLFSKEAKLNFLKGTEHIKDFLVEGSRFMTTFCVNCGSKLPKDHNGKILQVPAGSIDSSIDLKPQAHIFCASRANWDENLHEVAKFDEYKS